MSKGILSKFVLGTASFGNRYGLLNGNYFLRQDEANKIVKAFLENGGFNIDTSSGYGDSEKILSEVLNEFQNIKINITSKFSIDQSNDFEKVRVQIDNSFERFGNKLKFILCHTPEIYKSKSSDLVLKVFEYININYGINTGLSIYSTNELTNVSMEFRKYINLIQAPFNIFDDTASKLKKYNLIDPKTIVNARSIYLQGFLISDNCIIPKFKEEFESFKKLCVEYKLNSKEVCIRHALQNEFIDFITIGCNNLNHLNDLIEIMKSIKKNKIKFNIKNLESKNNASYLINPRIWSNFLE